MTKNDNFTREKLVELLVAALKKELTAGQREDLERWLAAREQNRLFFEALQEDEYLRENLLLYRRYDPGRDWRRVDPARRKARRGIYRWTAGAAGVALLVGAAWALRVHVASPPPSVVTTLSTGVLPGTYKARLTLEPGKTVVLGESGDSTVMLPEEMVQEEHSRLTYRERAGGEVLWHTLEVPRGGEYHLELADGTLITLNAESRIRYPNRFEGEERRVELEGEAFFNVTHQPDRPFIVSNEKLRVRVLGTSFNLKVYPDERQQATLLAGSVEVDCGGENVRIVPGEQLTWDGREWSVRVVDVTPYIAWKEQRFVFEDELLEEVLKKLERWYDINVYIRYPSLKEIRYTGNLPKYEEIDKVLHLLELAARVHFNLEGRTLFVEKE
jgi:ferric-dicitrate binding protein FerR (iron transport regulator)